MSECAGGQHADLTIGETVVSASGGGPIVAEVSDVVPGQETASVVGVDIDRLREAITTRFADDYPSVYIWSDGERLAITDHKTPAAPGPAPLDEIEERVHRTQVVEPTDGAVCALVDRDYVLQALDEVEADAIAVHVEQDRPVIFESEGDGAAVAPQRRPDHLPSEKEVSA